MPRRHLLLLLLAVAVGGWLRWSWVDQRLSERATAKGWRVKLDIKPPYDRVRWAHDEWMYYVSMAVNAHSGRGLFPDYDTAGDGVFVPPPGQSLLLLGVFRLAGGLVAPRTLLLLQATASAIALPFLWYLIGRSLASPAVGLVLAFALALHPDFVYWSAYLLNETHYLLAFSVLLYLLLRYVETPLLSLAAAAGLVLGAMHLLRPNAMLLGPFLAAGVLAWRGARRGWPPALCVIGLPVLVLTPWLVRNVQVHGEPILISSNMGIHLYLANNPRLDLAKTPYQEQVLFDKNSFDPALEKKLRRPRGRLKVTYYEYSRAYSAALQAYMLEQPLAFARNYLKKLASLFLLSQDLGRAATPIFRDSAAAYTLLHVVTVGGGFLGLAALLLWRRTPETGVLLLIFTYLTLSGAFSLPSSDGRYGLLMKPVLLALLCAGAFAARERWTPPARAVDTA